MRIVIDTNIFYQSFRMTSTLFEVLLKGLDIANYSLHIPEIVYKEVTNKYAEQLKTILSKSQSVQKDFRNLTGFTKDAWLPDEYIETLTEEYQTYLKIKLLSNGKILDYPDSPHEQIVGRFLDRRKPFKEKGPGYRDTLIWQSILCLAQETTEDIVFITNNKTDFADQDGNLHPDLQADLDKLGPDIATVSIIPGLAEFNEQFVLPEIETIEDMKSQIVQNALPGIDIHQLLKSSAVNLLASMDFAEEYYFPIPVDSEVSLTPDDQLFTFDPESIDVKRLSEDEVLIILTGEYEATLDIFIDKAYVDVEDLRRNGIEIWEHDWNKWYSYAVKHTTFDISLQATFNTNSLLIINSEIVEIEEID